MMTNIKLGIIAVVALVILLLVGVGGYNYYSRGKLLTAANETIARRDATISTLRASIDLQNSHVDEYESISNRLIQASRVGLADAQVVVKREAKAISAIRNSPKPADCEEIRIKMIEDALL